MREEVILSFGKLQKNESAREIANALLMAVVILAGLTGVNVWLANSLYRSGEINKVTAGSLPRQIEVNKSCSQCQGRCQCCVCGDKK